MRPHIAKTKHSKIWLHAILPPENTYRGNVLLGESFLICDFWTCEVCWAHISRIFGLAALFASVSAPHGDSTYDEGFAAESPLQPLPQCLPLPWADITAVGILRCLRWDCHHKIFKNHPKKCKLDHICNLPYLSHCWMGKCSRSQYVWWTEKNISQLALPNYSLINRRIDCTELLTKLGCHKGKTGKGHRFYDLWHFQAGTSMAVLTKDPSRYQECAYTNMPERVFLIFHLW